MRPAWVIYPVVGMVIASLWLSVAVLWCWRGVRWLGRWLTRW